MIENQTLIWRLRNGSFEALARIYEKYEALLVTIAAAILQDQAAAEDVVHDCFVKLAQEPHKLGLTGSLKHYLVVCVSNRARDQLRARRAKASVPAAISVMQEPSQIAVHSEQQQRLWAGPGEIESGAA